jgi:hypothetical protein
VGTKIIYIFKIIIMKKYLFLTTYDEEYFDDVDGTS